jgi:uncharacterized protein (DUF3084 family)
MISKDLEVSISKRESDINDKERDVSIREEDIKFTEVELRKIEGERLVIGNHYIGKRLINHHLVYK